MRTQFLLLALFLPSPGPVFPSAVPAGFSFTGSWNCSGTFRNSNLHRAKMTGTVILDGKWLELSERDVEPATGYTAEYLIGYDTRQKQFLEFDANNFGAAVYTSAEGWQDNILTLTSPLSNDAKAPYVADRFLYRINPPDDFVMDWQIRRTSSSEWETSDHLACKRA